MTAASFQSTVRSTQGFGVVGDLYSDEPKRSESFIANVAATVGTMQTVVSEGLCTLGGTGVLAGILFNPKVYALQGDGTNVLNPSLAIAAKTQVECLKEGEIVIALLAAAAIGDKVSYNTTNGVLGTFKATASFTASQATTVLTVSAVASGVIGVGTNVLNAANEVVGTIISLGTGTGGTGTYNLNTSATVASAAMHSAGVPASGTADAYGVITRYTVGGAGLAVAHFNLLS